MQVADIKTRDVTRGTIKTLDRAASSMHHLKEETIRSKTLEVGSRADNESSGSYAQDSAEHYAGDGTAFAMHAGTDMIIKSREHIGGSISENTDSALHSGVESPEIAHGLPDTSEQVQRAFKEQGVKNILGRREKARMADEEVLRNTEHDRLTGQIRRTSIERREKQSLHRTGRIAKNRQNVHQSADPIQRRRKEYAIKRMTDRKASVGILGRIIGRGTAGAGQNVRKSGRALRGIIEGSKVLFGSISIGAAVAIGIIVVMVFFGSAMNMTEDGNYIAGTGDTAIVEVARAQLGNVGGDKFWKWYGFKSHVHWCACFVSWCADQCGYIDAGIYPKFAGVDTGASWFKSHHRWSGGGYAPNPGDTIFFDFERDGVLDHVGLVETCDGKTITTIEGNYSNACKRASYRVGDPRIAGYGLMIRPAGNKARLIALKATQLAYPDAPREAKYHGGKPTAAYAEALKRAYPNRSDWGKPSKDGASCDVFVGTCIVDSGVDKGFPRGYRDQAVRLAKRTDLYECVVSTTSRNVKESELKDGDICTWEKASGTVHIWIYAGGKARQAAHDKWYPRTTSPASNLKISGKKVIRVYRVKE